MSAYELAEKYYPRLWSKERLKALVEANKLTTKEYKLITLETYQKDNGDS